MSSEEKQSLISQHFSTEEYQQKWSACLPPFRVLNLCLDIVSSHRSNSITYLSIISGLLVAMSSFQLQKRVETWLRYHISLTETIFLIDELLSLCAEVLDVLFYLNTNIHINVDEINGQERYTRVSPEEVKEPGPGYRV